VGRGHLTFSSRNRISSAAAAKVAGQVDREQVGRDLLAPFEGHAECEERYDGHHCGQQCRTGQLRRGQHRGDGQPGADRHQQQVADQPRVARQGRALKVSDDVGDRAPRGSAGRHR